MDVEVDGDHFRSAQTALSHPEASDCMVTGHWSLSQPSRKTRTSSPPKFVDGRLLGTPSAPSTVIGGDAATAAVAVGWLTDPGGGSKGRLCDVAALIGGKD